MIGFVLALAAALLFAAREGFTKKATQKFDVITIFWVTTVLSLPVYIIGVLIQGMPPINDVFWLALGANSSLFLVTSLLLIYAVKISPLSLTIPLLSFSPAIMLFTSWIMISEFPSVGGIVGIALIPLGALLLNMNNTSKGFIAPIRALKSEKGSRYVLIVAIIWSITANGDKIAIQNSSPVFYLLAINIVMASVLTIILLYKYKTSFLSKVSRNFLLLTSVSAAYSIGTLFQMFAIERILVPYVIAIKRAGLILGGILIGTLFFKEKNFRYKITGGLIMSVGIIIILLFN